MATKRIGGGREVLDFERTQAHANRMSSSELHYAILDIQKTLPNADALDRSDGGDRGGRYRDEASVYHEEQKARASGKRQQGDYEREEKAKEVEHVLKHDGNFHQGLPSVAHDHEATVDQRSGKSLQSGPRGGTFYVTASGQKVYGKH